MYKWLTCKNFSNLSFEAWMTEQIWQRSLFRNWMEKKMRSKSPLKYFDCSELVSKSDLLIKCETHFIIVNTLVLKDWKKKKCCQDLELMIMETPPEQLSRTQLAKIWLWTTWHQLQRVISGQFKSILTYHHIGHHRSSQANLTDHHEELDAVWIWWIILRH